jgi:ATP-binding cassette, subfamily C, bacterial
MKSVFHIAATVLKMHPLHSMVMIALMLSGGLLEAASITLVVPLLSKMTVEGGETSALEDFTNNALEFLSISNELGPILGFMVVVVTIAALVKFAAGVQTALIAERIAKNFRHGLFAAILKAKWGHSSQLSPGRINSALGVEVDNAAAIFSITAKMITAGWQAAVGFAVAALISVPITLGGIFFGALLAVLFTTFIRRTRVAAIIRKDAMADMLAKIVEVISSLKAIKAMGDEHRFLSLLSTRVETVRGAKVRLSIYERAVNVLPEPLAAGVLAIGLYVYLELSAGSLESALALAVLFSRTATAIRVMQRAYQSLVRQEPSYWFVSGLLREAEEAVEAKGGTISPKYRRSIELENLTVVYGGQTEAALNGVTLELPATGLVVVAGPSGAGKSTLVNAVAGIEDPTAGAVKVDGIDLLDIDRAKWRGMIGYVPQEIVLFPESVRENISMGNDDIAEADIIKVLKMADAWRFVRDLPHGIETSVGQAGSKLSGGQRQRISLARALVRTPRILILDEPTAALDSATEREICLTLKQIASSIMVLVISHRQTLVGAADIVVELESGAIKNVTDVRPDSGPVASSPASAAQPMK